MLKEIIKSIIAAVFTVIVTILVSYLISYINSPDAKVTIGYSNIENNKYMNLILVKNVKKDEYLKKFDIIIDNNIKISDIRVNDKQLDTNNNTIHIDSIDPTGSSIITLNSSSKLRKNNIIFAKNNQKFKIEYANSFKNITVYTILLILSYAIINFLLSVRQDIRYDKIKCEREKRMDEIEQNLRKTNNTLEKVEKKSNAYKVLYLKEISDMEKELQFYRGLISETYGKKISREELENIISKQLKLASKIKDRNLYFDDVFEAMINVIDKQ